ncbi:MAG: glutathione S-transferase family protein [Phenylobacterium sp.]|uniref:glutathione S-transferase family protein n=1 Tax=Phenylobacterium sp. TaxID=1871053 RepID=UPI0025E92FA1|nr:glutathione S-transferase family protein [Phenylobacterium sp.]MCG9914991.1 glutathione S-transferase family protein [Phenylobacterium sp.]
MMKLYSGDLSPYSAKVRMQIYAKGIEDIELAPPPGFPQAGFSKVSPIARIPALDLGDEVIAESEVISEYLEEVYPTPPLLGTSPRERARIRTISRIADIYVMNNIFMCIPQGRRSTRSEAVRDLLTGQTARGVRTLEHYLDGSGFAVGGALTLADCTLVPALFLVENVTPTFDVPDPLQEAPKVGAYWRQIQENPLAARVLVELHRGLEERQDLMRKAGA